jgi:NTP pyrophosphatase (non-canonical NTP hydrolase)
MVMESKSLNWLDEQIKNAEESFKRLPVWLKTNSETAKEEIERLKTETERLITTDYFSRLSQKIKIACETNGWASDWKEGGSYLHLETSEFVESLRGKKGTPEEEFADVMFVLIGMCAEHNVSFEKGFEQMEKKLEKMKEKKDVS